MPNRLALETSPYLQQHANNPVDWYSWGPEALELAAHEDRPIFLSIGYSSCHWCHVMERESFEDPEIAAVMNRLFVCIKVDREERPDLDAIYMQAVVAVSGAGGWPMSVFLTPDLKPFYGGTYYPPQDRGGLPSFRRVLEATANAYQQRRNEVVASAEQIVEHLRQSAAITGDDEELTPAVLDVAFKRLAPHIDTEWGGFGTSIKFPQPMVHEFLLRFGERSGEPTAQVMVDLTLDRMMRGGIYDHLGGGFHRYSTERTWLVPHFEKMLYDNALLVRLYVHAYQAMGRPEYRRVAEETIDFILRDMRDAAGGFYTALDADSEGEEGLFYIWSRAEILERLGNEAGERFCSVYGVTDGGNFEGANILFLPQELSKAAIERGVTEEQLLSELAPAKATLLAAREKRVWPFRDEKGADRLERPDARQPVGSRRGLRQGRLPGSGGGQRGLPADEHAGPGRSAVAHLPRRRGETEGLPGGLRLSGRRPAVAVRGYVHTALAVGGAIAGRVDAGAVLGPGRCRLLQHRH